MRLQAPIVRQHYRVALTSDGEEARPKYLQLDQALRVVPNAYFFIRV